MNEIDSLTLAFLDSHPDEAARVVETLSSADASALFAELNPRLGAPVLGAMLPTAAARVVAGLDEANAAEFLRAADLQAAVGILRHVGEAARARLLALLPPATGMATQLLLGYPANTVAAWTDPEVVALGANASSAEAMAYLRRDDAPRVEVVYVTDAGRHLRGEIALALLLRAPEASPLGTLMQPPAMTVPAMMPIASALTLPAWQSASVLPVVDAQKRLLGMLRWSRLQHAARDRARIERASDRASVTAVMAGSYWAIVSGLVGASLSLLPRLPRVRAEDR